ncbi:MAG: hypothetical protein WC869_01080 [Phycisphaerae bacterium]|jgi:hypothetical protein
MSSSPAADRLKQKLITMRRCADSSELKHLIEFVDDCVDNCRYDGVQSTANIRLYIQNSLEEFKGAIATLEKEVGVPPT